MQVPESRKEFSGNRVSKETETRKWLQGPEMRHVFGRKEMRKKAEVGGGGGERKGRGSKNERGEEDRINTKYLKFMNSWGGQ